VPAPRWRLGLSVGTTCGTGCARWAAIWSCGGGRRCEVLMALAAETGAGAVHWTRLYTPATVARDKAVKAALKEAGLAAVSHPGHLLHEPWDVETGGRFLQGLQPVLARGAAARGANPRPCRSRGFRRLTAWPASDRWRTGASARR
jgi:deoxyribodipyrimidine photo-lyase